MDGAESLRDNVFAGLSLRLDRAAERRDDEAWLEQAERDPEARFLLLNPADEAYLANDQDGLHWLGPGERRTLAPEVPVSLLGLADGRPYFLLSMQASPAHDRDDDLEDTLGARRIGLREAGLRLSAFEAGLFAYAKGLAHWQRETRHCGYCGSPLRRLSSGHRLQCTNEACGRLHFPRTDAAIIVLVEHEGACLLGRQASWPAGRYSTLAGFVEPGEALEDAVRREVAEESGVTVGAVRYHSSQPWPLPASLMVGFTATALSREIHLRDEELEDARWFTPEQIAAGLAEGSFMVPPPLSVSYQLIAHWLRLRAGRELDDLVRGQGRPL